jgi:hypothetical protein
LAEPQTNSYLQYLASDPLVLGVLGWVGLALTLLGLGIAIWQIRKVKSSADAATTAVQDLSKAIQVRERLLDISNSLRLLDSAKHHIAQRDYSKAVIFLEFARNESLQVQELASGSSQKKDFQNIVIRISA